MVVVGLVPAVVVVAVVVQAVMEAVVVVCSVAMPSARAPPPHRLRGAAAYIFVSTASLPVPPAQRGLDQRRV